jgi:tetratricopeptide (TPR) repeat protein
MLKYIISILIISFLFSCKSDTTTEVKKEKINTVTGDEIIDKLTVLIENDPLNAPLRFQRATRLYEKEMYDEAVEDLRIAILQDSTNVAYYHLLSDAFLDNALSTRALQAIQKAASLYPTRIPTLLKLSETQLILKQYNESISTLNNIIKIDGQNAEAYFMLGTVLKEMGEPKRALAAYQTATELDAKLIDAWISMGNLQSELKDPQAEKTLTTATTIDVQNTLAKHALAFYLQEHGKVPQALAIYDEIIVIDPSYTAALLNAGILYMNKKDLNKAIEKFKMMTAVDPKDWEGYYYKGKCEIDKNDIAAAKADLQTAVNLSNENENVVKLLAELENR